MTEAELQAAAIDLAHVYGYRVAHFRPALTRKGWRTPVSADGEGFPDLLLAGRGHIYAIECKSATGKLTPSQSEWLEALRQAGMRCLVLRPADLQSLPEWLNKREAA